MSHIDVSHITYSLPDGRVPLNDVTFRIPEGAVAALVGPNGAGKTTLLRLTAGISHPMRVRSPIQVTLPLCTSSSVT